MSKRLVAYFSASGVTARTAKNLAEAAGADLYEIKPEVPYTKQDLRWMNPLSRSSKEMHNKKSRPPLADRDANIAEYDVIFVGFPIWLAYHNLIQCIQASVWVHFLTIRILDTFH